MKKKKGRKLLICASNYPTLIFSLLAFLAFFALVAPLPSLSSHHRPPTKLNVRKFEIADDMFWKAGKPFRIIGGDLHYFRVLPEYWEDRLLRAKALGLNTIQTYVPWNLHEPRPGEISFNGIADIVCFLRLCQKLDLHVMLRPGPYICAEWDLGGFPAWLLAKEPALRLRSSDPAYLQLVDKWWGVLLPMVAPFLYGNGGPIIMVQIENEYGSFAGDKAYLHHLVKLARSHLGDDIILYTTDGGTRATLQKGTIQGEGVYSAVDFTTGDQPWPIFKLQKEFNAPGKSPPLSAEFYTGWLTHWGEKIAKTDADFTAAELAKILSRNGSMVLYMAHGGTNFGFYNGANTGSDESDYKPDLTSYDYDAPIRETGDVDNAKYKAIRSVIEKYSAATLPPVPANSEKAGYGRVKLERTSTLFDVIGVQDNHNVVTARNPLAMEFVGQMHGFVLYKSEYGTQNNASTLSISKVHDRAQVFIACPSKHEEGPIYVGKIERWSNKALQLPYLKCVSRISLYILVENMGRINYGTYISDSKLLTFGSFASVGLFPGLVESYICLQGILSHVYLNGHVLYNWKMFTIPLNNLNDESSSFIQLAGSHITTLRAGRSMQDHSNNLSNGPAFYSGTFTIDDVNPVKDTFLSVDGWSKGLAFINNFNLGRYWPTIGPQCNLYIPAPLLRHGKNTLVLFELESPNPEIAVSLVHHENFLCNQHS